MGRRRSRASRVLVAHHVAQIISARGQGRQPRSSEVDDRLQIGIAPTHSPMIRRYMRAASSRRPRAASSEQPTIRDPFVGLLAKDSKSPLTADGEGILDPLRPEASPVASRLCVRSNRHASADVLLRSFDLIARARPRDRREHFASRPDELRQVATIVAPRDLHADLSSDSRDSRAA